MQEMQLEMADASALGPHRVSTLDAAHLCTAAFSSATIYYPEGGAQLPSIVIVGGWGSRAGRMGAVLRVPRHRGDDNRHARALEGFL